MSVRLSSRRSFVIWTSVTCLVLLLVQAVPAVHAAGRGSPASWWRSNSRLTSTHATRLTLVRRSEKAQDGLLPGKTIVLPAREKRATAAVIYLHGLASDAEHMYPMIEPMRKVMSYANFVMPNADEIYVNGTSRLPILAWFDMNTMANSNSTSLPTNEDETRMRASVDRLHAIVEGQIASGIRSERIVLGGFSEGCVVAMLAVISSARQLGGLYCESGWLGLTEHLEVKDGKTMHIMQNTQLRPVPVWYGHGDMDPIVPKSWSEQSQQILREMGYTDLEVHNYPETGHWVSVRDETPDLEVWLAQELPPL